MSTCPNTNPSPKYTFRFYPSSLKALCGGPENAGPTIIETELTFEDAVAFVDANRELFADKDEDPRDVATRALAVADDHGVLSFDLAYVMHWCVNVLGEEEDGDDDSDGSVFVPNNAVPVARWFEFLREILAQIDVESDQFSEVDFKMLRSQLFPDLFTKGRK